MVSKYVSNEKLKTGIVLRKPGEFYPRFYGNRTGEWISEASCDARRDCANEWMH